MKKTILFNILFINSITLSFGQCPLSIQYDDAGNRIYRGTECDPECSIYVDNTNDDGYGSLRKAISCAKDGDTIQFDPVLIGDFIDLTTGVIPINVSIGLNLPEMGNTVFDVSVRSESDDMVFNTANNTQVYLNHMDIWAREDFDGNPRILLNEGVLKLENVNFYDDIVRKGTNSSLMNKGMLEILNQVNLYYVDYN